MSGTPTPAELTRPVPTRRPLPAQVRRHATIALRLSQALVAVDEAMSSTQGRTTVRTTNELGIPDPVGETVAAIDRLTLARRAAESQLMLERTAQALEASLRILEGAVAEWEGDRR
ncbi:hypothetical protein DEI93_09505 [Curtobacterium sp. MCBD17_035]|uniref:DUF7169 domain-containing protein n=1 Tax=Curtobacterium sp. MCBD17_035 TaxID=2175673 RepID=UPI0024DFF59C|nr:hypothetical protein [Curtobacterium sp. MCBD17_035]WIB66230.1 hypothetical protein DEI93_09505 [Curtobacterium sp. MCBD17_035]